MTHPCWKLADDTVSLFPQRTISLMVLGILPSHRPSNGYLRRTRFLYQIEALFSPSRRAPLASMLLISMYDSRHAWWQLTHKIFPYRLRRRPGLVPQPKQENLKGTL